MTTNTNRELPLDLQITVRDELVGGETPGSIAPQSSDTPDDLQAPSPSVNRRCDTGHREVLGQSELLSANPARQSVGTKAR